MSEEKNENPVKGGKNPLAKTALSNNLFVVCGVVIIALLGTVIYLLVNRPAQGEVQSAQPVNRNVVVNEDNVEEVINTFQETRTAPGYYEVTMNTTWNFPSGEDPSSNAYVENVATNTNAVYFDVIRVDTEETIYESPILPLGSHLDNITLDTVLPAGTYNCQVTYHLLDDENISISKVTLTLTIIIEG